MDQMSAYRALRLRSMMECQLHCLNGLRFFGNDVHQTDDSSDLAGQMDVQRFERQGYAGNGVST